MQINNNYAISQPRFGKLNSIRMQGVFETKNHPEVNNVIKAFKESETLAKLCENNNVKATFDCCKLNEDDYVAILDLWAGRGTNDWILPARAVFVRISKNSSEALKSLEESLKKINISELEKRFSLSELIVFDTINKKSSSELLKQFGETVDSLLK